MGHKDDSLVLFPESSDKVLREDLQGHAGVNGGQGVVQQKDGCLVGGVKSSVVSSKHVKVRGWYY